MTAPALTTTRTVGTDRRASSTDLRSFVALLEQQKATTLDLVVPADRISMEDGTLHLRQDDILTGDGVTPAGVYRYSVSDVADDGLSTRLNIPREFLRRSRSGGVSGKKTLAPNVPLYDALVNLSLAPQGDRAKYLVRLLTGRVEDHGTDGWVRAVMTNGYRIIDNFDVLVATLAGIKEAGINPSTLRISADLTERRMFVRVHAPEVRTRAEGLLKDYRSPFRDAETGRYLTGLECPDVYSGFTLTNSETGHGSYALTPQTVVEICRNGMTWTSDVQREVHLGQRLEVGAIQWSETTQTKHLELIRAKAADAVSTFLSGSYLVSKVAAMTEKAAVTIDEDAHATAVEVVAKECAFTDTEAAAVLADFGFGASSTVGGMVQAVTSAAQRMESVDRQWALESSTEKVLGLAGVLHRL